MVELGDGRTFGRTGSGRVHQILFHPPHTGVSGTERELMLLSPASTQLLRDQVPLGTKLRDQRRSCFAIDSPAYTARLTYHAFARWRAR